MKTCKQCNKPLTNTRKSYCDDHCKWRFNMLKQEREKHLPPVRKRTKDYFRAAVSAGFDLRGQGRRSGGMVKGAMGAMVPILNEQIQEVNKENLVKHFEGLPNWNYYPKGIKLGDGTWVPKEDIETVTGIIL